MSHPDEKADLQHYRTCISLLRSIQAIIRTGGAMQHSCQTIKSLSESYALIMDAGVPKKPRKQQ